MSSMNSNAGLYHQELSYSKHSPPYQCLAQPWFVRAPHPVYYPRHGCAIEPLICGETVFKRIAHDLKRAKYSVDIITWGFDPGMVLVRGASGEAGQRYGDLLREIATRKDHPVTVRLLVWHDDVFAQNHANNNPGYYGTRFPSIGSAEPGSQRVAPAFQFRMVCAGLRQQDTEHSFSCAGRAHPISRPIVVGRIPAFRLES